MNPKQKKLLWIAGVALAVVYFAPSFVNSYRRAEYIRQIQAARAAQAAQKSTPLPASAAPPAPVTANPSVQLDTLLGTWQGMATISARGMCSLKLEVRRSIEPGQYSGFPVLICMPVTPPIFRPGNANPVLAQMSPAAAVLTGAAKDGTIDFHVDRVISKGSGCEMTAFTVTPFGSDQVAAQWQEGSCPAGQILLKRLGK